MLEVLIVFLMAAAAVLMAVAGLWLWEIREAWANGDGPDLTDPEDFS